MNNQYDVIVVGAGNGGLMAAANTAKAGLKTLLLEKHVLPGGCASSFVRGRFEFEPSLHELCTVGTKENPDAVYQAFDNVGAKIDWRYEYKPFRAIVKGADGYDVTVEGGEEGYINSIANAVPGSKKSIQKFVKLFYKNQKALDYIYKKKGNPNPLVMITKHADFMRSCAHSVEEVQIALGMPEKARNIINTYWGYLGVPTDELCCMHYLSMVMGYVNDGAAMPYKRSHELSLALCDVIYKNGGEIYYNSEVTEFLYNDDGSMAGVAVGDKKYYAKEIISNIIADNVYNRSDIKKIPERELKLANARTMGISVATIYLGLDCTKEELGIKDYTVFVMNDANPRKQHDNRMDGGMYIVNCLNEVIPDCTPEGTCTLFFTMPVFGSDVPKDLRPEDYKKYKNEIAKKYIEDYEKLMGIDIQSHIEEISIATPVTFARYLSTPEGTIYGYRTSGWDNILTRISSEQEDFSIKGMTYCGGHSVRGDGYSCAYITGEQAAQRVIRRYNQAKAEAEGGNE